MVCVVPSPVTTWTCSGATPWSCASRPESTQTWGGGIDLQQEVGVAQPAPVEEGGLEDDVGAAAHGPDGGCLGGPERFGRALRPFELDDRPAPGAAAPRGGGRRGPPR